MKPIFYGLLFISLISCQGYHYSAPLSAPPCVREKGDIDLAANASGTGYGYKMAVQPFSKIFFQYNQQLNIHRHGTNYSITSDLRHTGMTLRYYELSGGYIAGKEGRFSLIVRGLIGYGTHKVLYGEFPYFDDMTPGNSATKTSRLWQQGLELSARFQAGKFEDFVPAVRVQYFQLDRSTMSGNQKFYNYRQLYDKPSALLLIPSLNYNIRTPYTNLGFNLGFLYTPNEHWTRNIRYHYLQASFGLYLNYFAKNLKGGTPTK